MGGVKHGKLSAHSKNSAKYKAEGKLEKNKAKKAEKHEKKQAYFAARRAKKESNN